MSQARLLCGDALTVLRTLPDASARCCVTSPPYWGLRDYGVAGQLGMEQTPAEYVARLVEVFREVRRVLTDDGTLWLNLGDSYTGSGKGGNPDEGKQSTNKGSQTVGVLYGKTGDTVRDAALTNVSRRWTAENGMAPKNLVGIPWRVAFGLQADGWYLRSDIIWSKPNPMPESVTDRPTKSHEYLFLLAKAPRYYFDAEAVREPHNGGYANEDEYRKRTNRSPHYSAANSDPKGGGFRGEGAMSRDTVTFNPAGRNIRSVWTIATQPYTGAHFATFPEEIARRCIVAGSAAGDTVLDPFGGSGTVGQIATGNGRDAILIELNPEYVHLQRQRIGPLLCGAA